MCKHCAQWDSRFGLWLNREEKLVSEHEISNFLRLQYTNPKNNNTVQNNNDDNDNNIINKEENLQLVCAQKLNELAEHCAWCAKDAISKQYNYQSGIELLLLSLFLQPRNPLANLHMSHAQWMLERQEDAIRSVVRAISLAPYNLQCYAQLCYLCFEMGDYRLCHAVAETAQHIMQSPYLRYYNIAARDQFGTKYDPDSYAKNIQKYLSKAQQHLPESIDCGCGDLVADVCIKIPAATPELPLEILVHIFLLLSLEDLYCATLATKHWSGLWRHPSFCKIVLTREMRAHELDIELSAQHLNQRKNLDNYQDIDWCNITATWLDVYKSVKKLEFSEIIRQKLQGSAQFPYSEQSQVLCHPYNNDHSVSTALQVAAPASKAAHAPKPCIEPTILDLPFQFPIDFMQLHMFCSGVSIRLDHHKPAPISFTLFPLAQNKQELTEKFIIPSKLYKLKLLYFPAERYLRTLEVSRRFRIGEILIGSEEKGEQQELDICMELDEFHMSNYGRIIVIERTTGIVTELFPNVAALLRIFVQYVYADMSNKVSVLLRQEK